MKHVASIRMQYRHRDCLSSDVFSVKQMLCIPVTFKHRNPNLCNTNVMQADDLQDHAHMFSFKKACNARALQGNNLSLTHGTCTPACYVCTNGAWHTHACMWACRCALVEGVPAQPMCTRACDSIKHYVLTLTRMHVGLQVCARGRGARTAHVRACL